MPFFFTVATFALKAPLLLARLSQVAYVSPFNFLPYKHHATAGCVNEVFAHHKMVITSCRTLQVFTVHSRDALLTSNSLKWLAVVSLYNESTLQHIRLLSNWPCCILCGLIQFTKYFRQANCLAERIYQAFLVSFTCDSPETYRQSATACLM